MPIVSLKLRPSVNVEFTPTLNEAGISECNLIRFQAGLPQKLGGWTAFYGGQVSGTPRDLHGWADLNQDTHLASGATSQLAVLSSGGFKDITPQKKTTNPTPTFTTGISSTTVIVTDAGITDVTTLDTVFFNTCVSVGGIILSGLYPIDTITGTHSYTITAATAATSSVSNAGAVPVFDTTSGSAQITVTLANHGVAVDDIVVFQIATSVGGLTVEGPNKVFSVANANQFTIAGTNAASSTATVTMNTGLAQLVYTINLGPPAIGVGYGVGTYGTGPYGIGTVPATVQGGTPITATNWDMDNWGEILLAVPYGDQVYYFPASAVSASGHVPGGFANAANITTGPVFNFGCFVAMPAQILVCYGSSTVETIGVLQDPLLVRWSDQGDFTNFTVDPTTQAGSYRVPTGSKIISALQVSQQALIWTDIDLYSMVYVGPGTSDLIFAFNKVGSSCGSIGQHAVTQLNGLTYWMGTGNFFVYASNGVADIPCSVWDKVFQDLDADNAWKCTAAANSLFNEITFYYPSSSGGTGEPDKYVKFNTTEKTWDYGTLPRSAWIDQTVLGNPIGASPSTRMIYQHEEGYNDAGAPMAWFFRSGFFVLSEGQDIIFMDWLFPDMKWHTESGTTGASVQVTFYGRDYPNGPETTYGPYTLTQSLPYLNLRIRNRQVAIKFSSAELDTWARLGNMRIRSAGSGRR